ncbi:MAG: ATP-binding protein [Lachnospiraceae bacterium]|nr:ATP-binding protein [Lachnospiraceae bacterium]
MGYYLNGTQAFSLYKSEAESPYFVDKTMLLRELIPLVEQGNKHICITRPRRFGKSVMAAMIGAFFSKGTDNSGIFDLLKIAQDPQNEGGLLQGQLDETFDYRQYMNQYDVIYINFIEAANESSSYEEFITTTKEILQEDLREAFPDVKFRKKGTAIQDLQKIYEHTQNKFILVFDEWDCIFHKDYTTDEDRRNFINWLAALTKDKGYIALSYMTGVLPIYVLHRSLMQDAGLASHFSATLNGEAFPAKYSSGSTINNFDEYTMAVQPKFSEYFGFTDEEVDILYERYLKRESTPAITREDLRIWYDGYHTAGGARLYNPRSVVKALSNNCLASYWTSSGQYMEIAAYIANDRADVKKDVALMVLGEAVPAKVEEYAATAMRLGTRNEILSAMVVYGFLNYENGKVHIPNKELTDEFAKTIREKESLGYINRLAVESDRMLQATLKGDTKTMEEILQFAHDTETPLLDYNDETELTAIVNLVYLAARDSYYVERENKAGEGYTDFNFYPERAGDDGLILELKVDDTPEAAIRQIKDRKYLLKFQGRMAEKKRHTGRVLLVGIGYSKKKKDHHCKVEIVRSVNV